jgi:hypothetical protein
MSFDQIHVDFTEVAEESLSPRESLAQIASVIFSRPQATFLIAVDGFGYEQFLADLGVKLEVPTFPS